MKMIFDKQLAVERLSISKDAALPFKEWKKDAANSIAKFILEHNCMAHNSQYDIAGEYTHEVFTVLVAQQERKLP